MKITIICEVEDVRPDSLAAAVRRVLLRGEPGKHHGIFVQTPDPTGFQETILVFDTDDQGHFRRGQSLVVGQIQRAPGEPLEYHS